MDFQCARCGNCCRWEGCVKVNDREVDEIAAFLEMPVEEFLEEYTRLRPDRTGLSLTEAENGSCIFFEDGDAPRCRINPVKPQQCRDFPLKWNFPNWQSECKGKLIE
ncbi:MAG: YkgJ family cysteine cluster protein [Lentisphaeria bacterium]|nr:YkgJ family cysteine cluster protein [Lentisphaeria bacterium]MBQ8755772.1 YkgJ family cysteine cluster protein [Lentisphaeria bacterium]MBQ9775674.1 YkgJ family cysteine cluster protein [Lentisphaeria bacterium]